MSLTEVIAVVVGALSSTMLAYFAYRRGSRADYAAQEHASTAQVYAGYGGLLQRYQEDNAELRRRLAECEEARRMI